VILRRPYSNTNYMTNIHQLDNGNYLLSTRTLYHVMNENFNFIDTISFVPVDVIYNTIISNNKIFHAGVKREFGNMNEFKEMIVATNISTGVTDTVLLFSTFLPNGGINMMLRSFDIKDENI